MKNKLQIKVITEKIYEISVEANEEELAMEEFFNTSGWRIKLISKYNTAAEFYDLIVNKKEKK